MNRIVRSVKAGIKLESNNSIYPALGNATRRRPSSIFFSAIPVTIRSKPDELWVALASLLVGYRITADVVTSLTPIACLTLITYLTFVLILVTQAICIHLIAIHRRRHGLTSISSRILETSGLHVYCLQVFLV